MPLQTTQQALKAKSKQAPGNVLTTGAKIRSDASMRPWGPQTAGDVADAIHGLQDQINKLNALISATPPPLLTFSVVDAIGTLIGWIGDQVTATAEYIGAWFKTLYIGGTSPADAKIIADASGNVTINGATITLNSGGVTTSISNVGSFWGVLSLKSTRNSNGRYSAVNPEGFYIADSADNPYAFMRQEGATPAGRVYLSDVAGLRTANLYGNTGTAAYLDLSDFLSANQVRVSTLVPLQVNGVSAIDISRNAALVNIAMSGTFTGTHAQNVGTGDSPTFSDVTTSAGSVNTLLASLQTHINTLSSGKANHGGALTGTVTTGAGAGGAVTGTVT